MSETTKNWSPLCLLLRGEQEKELQKRNERNQKGPDKRSPGVGSSSATQLQKRWSSGLSFVKFSAATFKRYSLPGTSRPTFIPPPLPTSAESGLLVKNFKSECYAEELAFDKEKAAELLRELQGFAEDSSDECDSLFARESPALTSGSIQDSLISTGSYKFQNLTSEVSQSIISGPQSPVTSTFSESEFPDFGEDFVEEADLLSSVEDSNYFDLDENIREYWRNCLKKHNEEFPFELSKEELASVDIRSLNVNSTGDVIK